MTHRRYIIWPEGQPSKAVETHHTLGRLWLQWWIGIKTYVPNPLRARRVTTVTLPPYNPRLHHRTWYDAPAIQIANICDNIKG